MTGGPDDDAVKNESTEIRWDAHSRVAFVRYAAGATLTGTDGPLLIDALTRWIGETGEPFAVLADGGGLRGTDAVYRATVSRFFRHHRHVAFIALIDPGPVIQVVIEMFRLGTGIPVKGFADESSARAWLRTKGIRT